MSQHAARATGTRSFIGLPRWATATAAVSAAAVLLGAAIGLLAWRADAEPAAIAVSIVPDQRMTFTYTATVPPTPAYDQTTVTQPLPVFRKLTDTVHVTYAYWGSPGRVRVAAELSSQNGWTSRVPLRATQPFSGDEFSDTVRLDLDALEGRARAAERVTGLPAGDLTVVVAPTVTTAAGTFRPEVAFTLSELRLALAGDASTLTVTKPGRQSAPSASAPALGLLGQKLPVTTARTVALSLMAAAVLGILVVAGAASTSRTASEATAIRRRHGNLILEVQPVAAPQGRPVVDVTDVATLVRLAERYELFVLHWARGGVETFVVQDQQVFYRYRTGAQNPQSATEPLRQHV